MTIIWTRNILRNSLVPLILNSILLSSAAYPNTKLTAYNYHKRFGIPAANEIKQLEDEIFASAKQRIVGGKVTTIEEFPYQAGLLANLGNTSALTSVCGGSLLSNKLVITAAHCWTDGISSAQYFTVVLGSNYLFYGGLRVVSNEVIVHPDWDPVLVADDIALVNIEEVNFSVQIKPIKLPNSNNEDIQLLETNGIVSGYGQLGTNLNITAEQQLSYAAVPIISNEECREIFDYFLRDSNICTSGESGMSPCLGDSGGPLTVERAGEKVLVGIVSFGSDQGCESKNPVAYTRITAFTTWINNNSI